MPADPRKGKDLFEDKADMESLLQKVRGMALRGLVTQRQDYLLLLWMKIFLQASYYSS